MTNISTMIFFNFLLAFWVYVFFRFSIQLDLRFVISWLGSIGMNMYPSS